MGASGPCRDLELGPHNEEEIPKQKKRAEKKGRASTFFKNEVTKIPGRKKSKKDHLLSLWEAQGTPDRGAAEPAFAHGAVHKNDVGCVVQT